MKICDDLRQAVLQSAIQGKLTTQRKEDGDARELLKQIAAEKAKLIKEKKIKKEKPLPEITEEEIPFEVPDNWVWCRVGEILQLINGDRGKNYPSKDKLSENGSIPFISAINIQGNTVSKEKLLYLSKKQYELLGSGKLIQNDLVVCIRGSLGKSCIYPFEIGAIASSLVILRNYYKVDRNFLIQYINSQLFYSEILRYDNGTAQPNLAAKDLSKFLIPLPPLAEQHRIVAKVEKLMAEIDELEKVENELYALKTAFPGDMKAALLQAAMQGKLTTQRKEDGDARDLLAQIAEEKARLIKEKKIKKEKSLPEITDDEIPFDVPDNWVWMKFGQIVSYSMGKTPPRKDATYWGNASIPWVSIADMTEYGYINITKEKINKYSQEKIFKGNVSPVGTLLMSFKLTVGRTSILRIPAYHNEAIISIYPLHDFNNIMRNYLFKILPTVTGFGKSKSAMKGATLNSDSISNLLIPLQPLAEQQRIVAKLEKLLPLCDGLVEE